MICKFIKSILFCSYFFTDKDDNLCQFCSEIVVKNSNVISCSHNSHLKCYLKNRQCIHCKKDTLKSRYKSLPLSLSGAYQ